MFDFERYRELFDAAEFYGNPAYRWLAALGVALAVAVLLRVVKTILIRRAQRLADRAAAREWFGLLVDIVAKTKWWFQLVLAVYAGSLVLVLPAQAERVIETATVIIVLLQTAIWGNEAVVLAIGRYSRQRMTVDAASVTTVSALGFLGRIAIWAVVALLILDNAGVEVTAMVAGLGIGGIAIGLAAQNILADLFASASIVLDKPFVLGDFIAVGTDAGVVEQIGLKTTRLKALSGEQLIFSNGELLQSRIRNFRLLKERRIDFRISVALDTPGGKLELIPGMIRDVIAAQSKARVDRVHFKEIGAAAMVFEAVYFVADPAYNVFMDIQQAVNLNILARLEEAGISLAFPTQRLVMPPATGS